MIVLAQPDKDAFTWIVGFLAVVLGSANVVGGFVVTDRMLEMFKRREPAKPEAPKDGGGDSTEPPNSGGAGSAGAGAGQS
jgi:NAD(P) transhydrogenase subunit alpha